jgi:hypothetical protein
MQDSKLDKAKQIKKISSQELPIFIKNTKIDELKNNLKKNLLRRKKSDSK